MKHYTCALILTAAAITNLWLLRDTSSTVLALWLFIIAVAALVEAAAFIIRRDSLS